MKTVNLIIPLVIPDNIEDEEKLIDEFFDKLSFISSNVLKNKKHLSWSISRKINDITTITYAPELHIEKWEYAGE